MIQHFFLQGSGWRLDGVVLSLPDRSLTVYRGFSAFRTFRGSGLQGFRVPGYWVLGLPRQARYLKTFGGNVAMSENAVWCRGNANASLKILFLSLP